MSDWSRQITDFQQKWLEEQQQLLDDWLKTLQGAGGGTPPGTWQQAIDAIEQQVNSALDFQKHSLMALAENSGQVEGTPESLVQWIHQIEEGIEQWNDVQHRLWQTWFDMLRAASPVDEKPGDIMMKNWQEMANQAMEFQEQWLSSWADIQPKSGKTTRKKPAGSPSPRGRSGTEE